MVAGRRSRGESDRLGLDETGSRLAALVGRAVPQWLARRAIDVAVSTDRRRYAPGEPVEITVEFRNRLPVPVTVETPRRRLWGWTVDGLLEASDERRFARDAGGELPFRPRERKRIRREWDGRFKRTDDDGTRWERAAPDEYEVGAFVATGSGRLADETTIRIEDD